MRRRGFSLIELLIVIAIIAIITGIAAPNLVREMRGAHETAAIGQIRAIHQAEAHYYSQFQRFAQNLGELGPPADLLPPPLVDGKASGYRYSVAGTAQGYNISAVPETFGVTGKQTFFSNETMVIRYNLTAEPATTSSPPLQ